MSMPRLQGGDNGLADGEQLNQAQELYQNAQQQMQNALRNIREAANFVVEAENKHPNRHDICRQGTQVSRLASSSLVGDPSRMAQRRRSRPFSTGTSNQPSAFGGGGTAGAAGSGSTFGQPPALGQRPNPFGQPSQSTPTFGQTGTAWLGVREAVLWSAGTAKQPRICVRPDPTLGAKPVPLEHPRLASLHSRMLWDPPLASPSQLGQKPSPFCFGREYREQCSQPFRPAIIEPGRRGPEPLCLRFESSGPSQTKSIWAAAPTSRRVF